jgi:hypothetical protein
MANPRSITSIRRQENPADGHVLHGHQRIRRLEVRRPVLGTEGKLADTSLP